MINKSLPAYRDFNPLNVPGRGDAARARTLLQASGLALPVKITVAYRKGSTLDNAMAALRQGWQEAGFSVTLQGIEKDYFTDIASVQNSRGYDVMWAVGVRAVAIGLQRDPLVVRQQAEPDCGLVRSGLRPVRQSRLQCQD
jgi:ABC-type transport system substrate-binding protein